MRGQLVHVNNTATLFDHQPICFFISWGAKCVRLPVTHYILNVFHLQNLGCLACIQATWNSFPEHVGTLVGLPSGLMLFPTLCLLCAGINTK